MPKIALSVKLVSSGAAWSDRSYRCNYCVLNPFTSESKSCESTGFNKHRSKPAFKTISSTPSIESSVRAAINLDAVAGIPLSSRQSSNPFIPEKTRELKIASGTIDFTISSASAGPRAELTLQPCSTKKPSRRLRAPSSSSTRRMCNG